ncbi:MAG: hypothetical protein AAB610_02480 [Patescibacteria group bacterium]
MNLLPKIAHAASSADVVNSIVPRIVDNIVMPIIQLIFALAILVFIWGLIGFFKNGEDSEARTTGQKHILYGTIGMAIMVSVYGIIRLVAASVGQTSVLGF